MAERCYILAGPNGAGKTTFSNELLPIEADCLNFINPDLIAQGLAPFQPEKMALEAGRPMIIQINECVRKNESFRDNSKRKMVCEEDKRMEKSRIWNHNLFFKAPIR